ncbi:hypothetical protein MO973_23645 [Paenibacillus sp. TRM 82003]|nr:hypothetical protein [Paenibacillus sp. TRM 82003]
MKEGHITTESARELSGATAKAFAGEDVSASEGNRELDRRFNEDEGEETAEAVDLPEMFRNES